MSRKTSATLNAAWNPPLAVATTASFQAARFSDGATF
jgi:hypothetical protein